MLDNVTFLNAVQYMTTIGLAAGLVWLMARLSPSMVRSLKNAGREFVAHEAELIAAVDQIDDPLVRLFKSFGVSPQLTIQIAPRVLRAVADAIEDATAEGLPLPERAPDA